jgi:hypothetical protein
MAAALRPRFPTLSTLLSGKDEWETLPVDP